MDPAAIEKKLRLGEDSTTEFKGVAQNGFRIDPNDLAKALVALANASGGHEFLGVEDDGSLTGVGSLPQTDALMRQITQVCQDSVIPPLSVTITKIEIQQVALLLIEVPGFSPNRPYRAGHIYYVRDANRSREATREELVRLLQSADYHFDEQAVSGTGGDSLDSAVIREFLLAAYDVAGPDESLRSVIFRN